MKSEQRLHQRFFIWHSGFVIPATSKRPKVIKRVKPGVVAVTEVELDGVAADHAPVLHGDAGKGLLICATDLVAQQITFTGVFSTG